MSIIFEPYIGDHGHPDPVTAVADPTKNLEAREAGLMYVSQLTTQQEFSFTLSCSDSVYYKVFIAPTKLISNPGSKVTKSKLGVFGL